MENGDKQSLDLEMTRRRLEEELREERDSHNADLADRDFAMNQTQITYQSESQASSYFNRTKSSLNLQQNWRNSAKVRFLEGL